MIAARRQSQPGSECPRCHQIISEGHYTDENGYCYIRTAMTNPSAQTMLAPCPFCGGAAGRRGEFIECADCSAQGPTDREVVTGWNARAASASAAVREALTEDQVMNLITKNFGGKMWESLTRTVWKDGIDIQYPTFAVMHFVGSIAAALATPEEASTAAGEAETKIMKGETREAYNIRHRDYMRKSAPPLQPPKQTG